MAISADAGGTGSPFAKFTNLGDTLVGALGSKPSECQRQARDFTTGEPAVKPDGKPRLEEVLYLIAMPGTTAHTGSAESGFSAIEPGDVVRFSVSGYKWGQVIEARRNLPAANGFRLGESASGDVYTITLVGWSAETKNPAAAEKAGYTVVDGRILLRSQEEKDAYVIAQSRQGGNTNPAKDYTMELRRPTTGEKRWEQLADEVFLAKPWAKQTVTAGAPAGDFGDDEPF